MRRIIIVAGARPNFIKIAPLVKALKSFGNLFETQLVHTGQHYDYEMSDIFFHSLNIPRPDVFLNVGSASHAVQTSRIMASFEKVLLRGNPDMVVVVGDVNSTLACSLVTAKLGIRVAHVEAGLRSFDRTMPEEINRIVTDSISDLLFVSESSGVYNLKKEGVDPKKIHFVGNIMIDTLFSSTGAINRSDILKRLKAERKEYAVLTLHRPANVDSHESLYEIVNILGSVSKKTKLIYPIHPRTAEMIKKNNFMNRLEKLDNLLMVAPLGYIDFIKLVKESRFVLTDSGGIQEETTVLGIPCLTMRENTERPITVIKGTNYLVGRDRIKIEKCLKAVWSGKVKKGSIPRLWDGKTAERVINILKKKKTAP